MAAFEGPIVDVWPSQSEVYLGESVFLQCRLESNFSSAWTYRWYRNNTNTTLTLNPRHSVCGDSYSITAVTSQDAGSYWCRAEQRERNITTEVEVQLRVSALLHPSLALTPSSRQVFSGERVAVQCPARTRNNSSGWKLWHFSPEEKNKRQMCVNHSNACVFVADRANSGLYWCEEAEGRSRAINITVSYGNIILKTPAFSVHHGGTVVLHCQYRTGNQNETIFFKNGIAINTSETTLNLTMEKVTQQEEGLYKCGSQDRKMESKESWLSVTLDGVHSKNCICEVSRSSS
ncbi:Fc receptor-like protein 2 [Austrofundulus limnaeus]|uniref:Fc receptor-like protein 2 n=1 Tax=Austrofundulus limnaeus TaxID=52670 RepID=A0A2I4D1Y1_AUSLI|nr:PREDICTED: Fc receptor-like protein 2 [Austrofundulus limnaeus]